MVQSDEKQILYLVYDGECILCRNTAQALKIKQSVGQLQIINAREGHPLVKELQTKGYDLNEGIVVKLGDQCLHGKAAMHMLANLSTPSDTFNRLTAWSFKYKPVVCLLYPVLKFVRRALLLLKSVPKISVPDDYKLIKYHLHFDDNKANQLLYRRYLVDCQPSTIIQFEGHLDISISFIYRLCSPLIRLFKGLAPYPGEKVHVIVSVESLSLNKSVRMHRLFSYADKTYEFTSYLISDEHSIIEMMQNKLGVRLICCKDDNKLNFKHSGYVLHILNQCFNVPLSLIFGTVNAEEAVTATGEMSSNVSINHILFGELLRYTGNFKLLKN